MHDIELERVFDEKDPKLKSDMLHLIMEVIIRPDILLTWSSICMDKTFILQLLYYKMKQIWKATLQRRKGG